MKSRRAVFKLMAVLSSVFFTGSLIALRSGFLSNDEVPASIERRAIFLPGSKSEEEARQISDGISGGLPSEP